MSRDQHTNVLAQPVGAALPGWTAPPFPPHEPIAGRYCRLEPLAAGHARGLWDANARDTEGRNWTYLPYGSYDDFDDYARWVESRAEERDPQFFAAVTAAGPVGVLSLMRIDPPNGVIEVGGINFSPLLQRTPAATEAIYLLMRRVFELGYRRFEWKCDALNAPSRRAAGRFGFSYEGIFRQAIVTKGRNRDTAWYACIDREWPALREAYERWLAPANFDASGRQRVSLASLTSQILVSRG